MGGMTERTLDWRPKPDLRSLNFLVADLSCYNNGKARTAITRKKRVYLDQGREGACTGFGEENVRSISPRAGRDISDATARRVYEEARRQDEWEGEDYEGSSVNGAMKAARLFGWVKSWHWCLTTAEVRHALSYHGAVEAGTNWWSGMWDPDEQGYLRVQGTVVGGHAWCLSGFKKVGDADDAYVYRMENSWGRDWGDDGGAWILESDLQQLLRDQGEFACPLKVA